MTPERAQQERQKADDLLRAYEALKAANAKFALVIAYIKSGDTWSVDICIKKGERSGYYNRAIDMSVKLPGAVVQQQALDEMKAAKRRVIQLGGELP